MARIDFQMNFNLNKSGLNELINSLKQIQNEANGAKITGNLTNELKEAAQSAKQLEQILNSAWNSKIGQLDLGKVNSGIKTTYGSLENLQKSLNKIDNGQSFNKLASGILNTNIQLKQSNKLLDEMATSMANTVKWGITSSIFNNITNQIQKAWNYTVKLDTSLNDIRIVTDKSADSMERFARQANEAAKNLGTSTKDYTEASLIYYQQGLSDEETRARTETTLKAANVTGQASSEVSEQLTAIWNGYKVTAEETELYIDKVAKVAAATAADLEELSTGMSKVASAASTMGVDVDQLNALLATTISVTREAPETIGTSFRTIFARMTQLQSDGTDEFGVTLGRISAQLESMGIQILDQQGEMRDLGTVITEVGEKWQNWSEAQKVAAAQAIAGTRQYSRLMAVFENWDMYNEALTTSKDAVGTLNEQQSIYMESTEAHLQKLSTEAEKTYDILFNQDTVNDFTDALTGALSVFNNFLEGIGGGTNVFRYFGGIVSSVFSRQIGGAIETQLENIEKAKNNLQGIDLKNQAINLVKQGHGLKGEEISDSALEIEANLMEKTLAIKQALTDEQAQELISMQEEIGLRERNIEYLSEYKDIAVEIWDTEHVTLNDFKDRLALEKESLTNREKELGQLDKEIKYYNEIMDASSLSDEDTQWLYDRVSSLRAIAETQEESNILEEASINIASKKNLTEKQIEAILKTENYLIEEQKQAVDRVKQGIEGKEAAENGYLAKLKLEQQQQKELIEQMHQQSARQAAIQGIVQGIGTITSALTTLFGIVKTLGDESLTTEEKFSQIGSTLLLSVPMLIAQFAQLAGSIPAIVTGLTGMTAAEFMAAQGATTMGAAIWTALAPILPIILAVIGAIVAVGAVIYGVVKAYNHNAEAAKEAAEAVEALTTAYTELKDAYEEVKKSLKDYQESYASLEKMTRGTEEWHEAVTALNEKVLELMDTYPELAKYVSSSNGVLTISKEGQDELINQQRQLLANNYRNLTVAKMYGNETEDALTITETARELKGYHTQIEDDPNTLTVESGTEYHAVTESMVQNLMDAFEQNPNIFNPKESAALAEALGNSNEELIKNIQDGSEKIIAAKKSIDNNTKANEILAKEYTKSYLDEIGGEAYQESKYQGIISNAVDNLKVNEDEINKLYEETYKDKMGGKTDKDIQKEYAELMGYKWESNDWGNKGTYTTQSGSTITITDAEARKALARDAYYKENNLGISADEYAKQIQGFETIIKEQIGLTDEEAVKFISSLQKGQEIDFSTMSKDQVDAFNKYMQSNDWQNYYKLFGYNWGHSYEEAQNYLKEDPNAGGSTEKIIKAIESYYTNPDTTAYYTRANEFNQEARNIQSTADILSTGDESDLDEEQLALLDSLEAKYIELGEIKNRTSHEYLTLLREIKEQDEANAMQQLQNAKEIQEVALESQMTELDSLKSQWDNLTEEEKEADKLKEDGIYVKLTAKTDEVEEALEKLQDTNYQIKVQVDADLASDVEDAFGIADELTQLQDAVSEDLTYTFEEAQELIAKGYGEMFTNAKETSENTIQVNKDVMNSFIDSRQAEIEADRQAKIDQLETQKTYLKTQRDALVQKLNALKEAASAETAVDAATAMEKVNNANIAYEAATNALNEELNDEAEGATENQKINAELYNALGGMYEENVENENQAEADATNNQQANINKRIENVHALHNAYSNLARQVKASESGEVIPVGNESATGSGVNAAPTGSTNIEANTQTANEISIEDLKSKTEALFNNNQTQYKDTINALIKSTQAEIDAIDAQIGAADAGIAALKSSGKSLDKAQKDAKVGGKGSDKDPDKEDAIENEKDLYHDVNIELEQISTTLGRLQKQQDKLFGKNLIENLNAQIETLNDQIETTGEKIKIAEGEAAGLKASLSGQGVIFNADGTIANYAAAYEAQLAYVNSIIAQYNAMDAESQEAYKETVEQAKANFEKFVDNIENYDTLISETIPGLQDEIQDAINEQIELQIQKFNMEIELRLDLAEAEREWNEFKKRIIDGIDEDDILGNAKARLQDFNSYYKVDGTGSVQAGTKQVNSILEQLRQIDETGTSSVYGDNKQKALEDLDTYYTQLISDLNDLADLQEEIHQAYLDMMDEAQEKFDEQLEVYDQISSLIEHDMKLIELVGGEDSYAELSEYYNKQHENNLAQLDFQRQQVDFWKQQMDAAEEGSDKWESAKEKWMEAIEDWRSSVEEAVEAIQDKYLNAINLIFQGLNDKVTNGMGLEYVSEEWELINANADQYLDTINSMYEIQSLESKYLDAIDQTDSISAQRKLNDLMQQELSALEEKDKLTQYDIDRANMKYEIALKQIALEEAQQNKSSMRLRRDSQGNYTYQFVSDQDAIGQAQDELSALQNELYNFDLEKYRNNLDELYQIWEEYQQKMAEAAQINDPEERAARELLLNEQYGELINGLVEQNATIRVNLNESAFAELADLYNVDVANFEQLSLDEQDILMNDMVPQWNSGIQQMADVFAGEGGFTAVCEEAMNQLAEATEIYEDDLQEVEETSGITFDTIADGTDNAITQTQDLLADNDELINSYERELEAVQAVIDKMDTLIGKYKSAEAAAKAASEAAYKYEQEEKRKAAEEAAKENAKNTSNNTTTLSSNNTATTPTSGGTGSSGGGDGNLQVGDTATYSGKYYYDSYGTSPAGSRYSGVTNGVKVDILNNNPYGAHIRSADGKFPDLGWVKKSQLSGFDTGGYTGNWGDSSGRLALLHQKELVLNANDTTNMLSALKILEGIVGTVGSSMLTRLANLGSGIGAPMSDISASSDTLEQNVHIEASFPNVQNSKEIEDAFNNLVNIASQRVHRNKR